MHHDKIQDACTLVNARVSFGADNERWMVEVWPMNLTDEEYVQVNFGAPVQTAAYNVLLGTPRAYGLPARFKVLTRHPL